MAIGNYMLMYMAKDQTIRASVIERLVEKAISKCSEYGIKVLIAVAFIIIGFKLTRFFIKILRKSFTKHNMDASVCSFLLSLINICLRIMVLLTAITIIGIQVTSFLTVLGSASIAVGLALQGSLANLAGGVLILLLKPFKIDDYIRTESGIEGTVVAIDIFYTKLRSTDNQSIVIPNGALSNSSIVNVTKADYRRIDLDVEIAYSADIREAKKVLAGVLKKEKRIVKEKNVDIFVNELGASGINLGIHVWVRMEEYWATRWQLLENIKYALDEAGIEIPYQTMDINVNTQNTQEEVTVK